MTQTAKAPERSPAQRGAGERRKKLPLDWRARAPQHMSEGAAAAVAAEPSARRTSLAALLTGHILRDGELVLLILKPSLWFILFNSMRFSAAVLIGLIAGQLWLPDAAKRSVLEVGILLLASRMMWSILQWMGRLYVLTDQRVVRLSGVFQVEIFDCALRKIARTRLTRNTREKLWRLGSIEIQPNDMDALPANWQTVRRPAEVLQKIQATIERSKQGDCGFGG